MRPLVASAFCRVITAARNSADRLEKQRPDLSRPVCICLYFIDHHDAVVGVLTPVLHALQPYSPGLSIQELEQVAEDAATGKRDTDYVADWAARFTCGNAVEGAAVRGEADLAFFSAESGWRKIVTPRVVGSKPYAECHDWIR